MADKFGRGRTTRTYKIPANLSIYRFIKALEDQGVVAAEPKLDPGCAAPPHPKISNEWQQAENTVWLAQCRARRLQQGKRDPNQVADLWNLWWQSSSGRPQASMVFVSARGQRSVVVQADDTPNNKLLIGALHRAALATGLALNK